MPLALIKFDELDGQLGQSARSLVAKLNELIAEINDFRQDEAEELPGLATIGDLAGATSDLQDAISQAFDSAGSALASEVGVLNALISSNATAARSNAEALAAGVESGLSDKIDQVSDATAGALASEVKALNDRIGALGEVTTNDATPTKVAELAISPYRPALVTAKLVAIRQDHFEGAAFTVKALARAVASQETLTVAVGNAANGDQVEIDGVTYTFETVLTPGGTNNVLIGGSNTATIDNLVAAIMQTGTPDTEYGAGTAEHPTFKAFRDSASTMVAIARLPGTGANGSSVTDPVDGGGTLSWGAATTSGGTDLTLFSNTPTTEHADAGAGAWAGTLVANADKVEATGTGEASKDIDWGAEISVVDVLSAV